MNINTYDISTITTILKYFVKWPKRILFMLSPLPYFALKMQWDTWDKLAA